MRFLRAWSAVVVTGALWSMGCDGVSTESVPSTGGTDRLWAASNTYCARKPNGLICWRASEGNITAYEPTVFDGIGRVASLSLRPGEACALSNLGMGCFRLEEQKLARGGEGVPKDFIAFGTERRMFCARGDKGVRCFTDKIEEIAPVSAFGEPRRLVATLREGGACAEYDEGLRCYTIDGEGQLRATVQAAGVRGVKAVRIGGDPAWMLVLDEEGLRFSSVSADVVSGRPITEEAKEQFPDSSAVSLEPVESAKGVEKVVAEGKWTYVLDEEGVKSVSLTGKGLEVQLWPMDKRPEDLWVGRGGFFFVSHGGEMTVHGWKGEKRLAQKVRGVDGPKDVAAGDHYTCIVHDEGISCLGNAIE